jgi:hypothetical protein
MILSLVMLPGNSPVFIRAGLLHDEFFARENSNAGGRPSSLSSIFYSLFKEAMSMEKRYFTSDLSSLS